MLHQDPPWIGLLALIAMFIVPYLPNWLFDGPRTIKHYPRRHICADCGASWQHGHDCTAEEASTSDLLHGDLRRKNTSTEVMIYPMRLSETDD
jgi:hypothetical protein